MKKIMMIALFLALTSTAYADNFVTRESDRSGLTGTGNMVKGVVQGIFGLLGGITEQVRPK